MSNRRRLLFAACFAAPVLAEVGARAAATVANDIAQANEGEQSDWAVFSPTLGWERRPGFKGEAGLAEREFDAAGYFATDTKVLAGGGDFRKKVVFIGDSTTFGFGARTPDSFVQIVERRLAGVATINLGVMGYSSYQGKLVVDAQLPLLKPDLIVASFNVDDRRGAQDSRGQDGPQTFHRLYEKSQHQRSGSMQAIESLYVYRAMRRALRRAEVVRTPEPQFDVSQMPPRVGPAAYRKNLRQIAATARALRIPVMFLILRDSPVQAAVLRAGVERLRHGDLDASVAYLAQAVDGSPVFSGLGRIYLSEALTAKGDKARAREVLKTRAHYDAFQGDQLVRLDTEYNDIMGEVARETGSDLVNGADVLEQEPLDFIDPCHFNANGHRRLGEHLAKRIAAVLKTPVRDTPEAHATG